MVLRVLGRVRRRLWWRALVRRCLLATAVASVVVTAAVLAERWGHGPGSRGLIVTLAAMPYAVAIALALRRRALAEVAAALDGGCALGERFATATQYLEDEAAMARLVVRDAARQALVVDVRRVPAPSLTRPSWLAAGSFVVAAAFVVASLGPGGGAGQARAGLAAAVGEVGTGRQVPGHERREGVPAGAGPGLRETLGLASPRETPPSSTAPREPSSSAAPPSVGRGASPGSAPSLDAAGRGAVGPVKADPAGAGATTGQSVASGAASPGQTAAARSTPAAGTGGAGTVGSGRPSGEAPPMTSSTATEGRTTEAAASTGAAAGAGATGGRTAVPESLRAYMIRYFDLVRATGTRAGETDGRR